MHLWDMSPTENVKADISSTELMHYIRQSSPAYYK
jgi:hypothetical protein